MQASVSLLNAPSSNPAPCGEYAGASVEAIQHHYDVGNDFYRLWLDPTLSYSCALWECDEGATALQRAQERKIDYFISETESAGTAHVLEIGCGWGALLSRLVNVHGVQRATGLTLSAAQADWISEQNLRDVTVRLENWFSHEPPQPYDAIISIAAFEAFARPGVGQEAKDMAYRQFFQRCHRSLKAGAKLGIQTIARGNMFREDFNRFISIDVFPESDLPTLAELARASERLFEVLTIRNDREDYVRTLKAWRHNLKLNRPAAVRIAGEGLVTRYEKYLDLSMLGFYTGATDLLRIIFRRIDNPSP